MQRTSSYPVIAKQFLESLNFAEKLDADTAKNIDKLKYAECPHFVKTEITDFGKGTGNIIDNTVDKAVGVCTINKGQLKANENLILSGLVLGHANPADTVTGPADFGYSTVKDAALEQLNALQHGTIIIEQEDRRILELPVDRFYHGAATDRSRENEGWNFDSLRLIKAATPFEVKLELPAGIDPGSSKKAFFYVGFKGWVTRL